jgi:hypothetical protein
VEEKMTPEQRKRLAEKNRQEMPNVAELIDTVRQHNPGLKFRVVGAEDLVTGKKIGRLDKI